jgi:hypothetical protein
MRCEIQMIWNRIPGSGGSDDDDTVPIDLGDY